MIKLHTNSARIGHVHLRVADLDKSISFYSGILGFDVTFRYGPASSNWIPIAGDWNGNGQTTVGLYNPSTSAFYLKNSHSGGAADIYFLYGPAAGGWLPLTGDWNGDVSTGVGLFDKVGGMFYLRDALSAGFSEFHFQYGPKSTSWDMLSGFWLMP